MKTPGYKELLPYANHIGSVEYRREQYHFIYCAKGSSQWLFLFDPQGEGMTLTNAADLVLEFAFKQLLKSKQLDSTTLKDLISKGSIILQDSNNDYSQVNLKFTDALDVNGNYVITGVRVARWNNFNFTKEFFELFKLMG